MLVATLGFLLFASSAPSPLYIVYQAKWHFSPITLTSVFAVYAVALLMALIFAGSLSDRVGRRPVLLGALAVQLVAMVLFGLAHGVGALFAARIVQGVATGVGMGAISAALIDLAAARTARTSARCCQRRGAAVRPRARRARLRAARRVRAGPAAPRLLAAVGVFVLAIAGTLAMPETVHARRRRLAALDVLAVDRDPAAGARVVPGRRAGAAGDVGARRPVPVARPVAGRGRAAATPAT